MGDFRSLMLDLSYVVVVMVTTFLVTFGFLVLTLETPWGAKTPPSALSINPPSYCFSNQTGIGRLCAETAGEFNV